MGLSFGVSCKKKCPYCGDIKEFSDPILCDCSEKEIAKLKESHHRIIINHVEPKGIGVTFKAACKALLECAKIGFEIDKTFREAGKFGNKCRKNI